MPAAPQWKTVEPPPRGGFIGWGVKPGQHVTGEVVDFDETGGTDFGGKTCPQLEVLLMEKASSFNKKLVRTFHEPGERVVLTCGLSELKDMVLAADLNRGDLVKIVMTGEEELPNGNTIKRFSMQVAPGAAKAKGRANVHVVESIDEDEAQATPAAAEDDDDIPF